MDVMKYTLEEFLKMCENADAIARFTSNKTETAKSCKVLTRISNECQTMRDCCFGENVSVIFASSKSKDENIHLTTFCDTNFALSVAVGLVQYILSKEDVSLDALMEEFKSRVFSEED